MYNSKRFETVKNMRENKKISNVVQAAIGVLAVVLAALIVWMMVLVSGIQGTARVVNYAGLVRGETQRLVKMEIAGQAEDGMMESVESFINGKAHSHSTRECTITGMPVDAYGTLAISGYLYFIHRR